METPQPMTELTRDAMISLRPITHDNYATVVKLHVAPEQRNLVAANNDSLTEAAYEKYVWKRAIYANEMPVGFVMLYDDPHKPMYYLWRLMIDQRYQGLGFGRRAVAQVIEYVLGRPGATELLLSYVPGAGGAGPFYEALGFVETGEVVDHENVMRLDLVGRPRPAAQPRPLTHVVQMKFADPTPAVLGRAVELLRGLEGKIPELRAIEVGLDILHSARSFDLVLITRFDSLAALEAYQAHPEHVEVLEYLRTVLERSVAVDFELD